MTMRYVVFDVETPNRFNDRMSAIGVTVVEDGAVTESLYSLVDPETDFDWFNTRLTGIGAETVRGAPTFPQLWETLEPVMSSGTLAAHNAVFDLSVLRACLRDYGLAWKKSVPYLCTVQMGRKLLPGISHKLNDLCGYFGIGLDHHHADSDSRACAEILLRYLGSGADPDAFLRTFDMTGSCVKAPKRPPRQPTVSAFRPGETAFITEGDGTVREVKILGVSGGFCTLRFSDGGGVRLRESRVFHSREDAEKQGRR